MRSPILLSLSLSLLLAALTACSDDASSSPAEAPACSSLQATGPFISEAAAASLPEPEGGPLSAGAYVLTGMQGKGEATPRRDVMTLATIASSPGSFQVEWVTEHEGGEVIARSGSVAMTSATELTFLWACPDTQNEAAGGYTSDGSTLTLFGSLGTITFQRQ